MEFGGGLKCVLGYLGRGECACAAFFKPPTTGSGINISIALALNTLKLVNHRTSRYRGNRVFIDYRIFLLCQASHQCHRILWAIGAT